MHTTASDGWPTPEELVEHAARRAKLDVIAVTDHDTIDGALRAKEHAARRAKFHVIVGEEVSSRDGHIVALFLERKVRPGMSAAATLDAIHDQGGLAIAVHPFWRTQRRAKARPVHGVGWLAAELDFDAIEVENATPGFYLVNQLARRLNHILDAVGRAFTEFSGKTPEALRAAIESGMTTARRRRYRAVGLVRYAAWGLNHQRYAVG
jgi:predicted metal-dependent phosphoesterase TrpH